MTQPWVAIQRNPMSGAGARQVELLHLCRRLRELGIKPRMFSKRERLAERMAIDAHRGTLKCIVAAGGDGTVADIINRYPGTPVAILPLGTENLLARFAGVGCDGPAVAEMIAAGRIRQLDLGLLNGRRFALMVSAGFDAHVVHGTHARRRGHIRKWSYLQPIAGSLRTYGYPQIRVEIDGHDPFAASLVLLANLPAYAMGLPLAASAAGDDGLLDLRSFERPSAFQMFRYLYKVIRRRHEALPDVRSLRIPAVRLTSETPVPVQCDGDPAGFTPCEIRVLPGALTLIVPG